MTDNTLYRLFLQWCICKIKQAICFSFYSTFPYKRRRYKQLLLYLLLVLKKYHTFSSSIHLPYYKSQKNICTSNKKNLGLDDFNEIPSSKTVLYSSEPKNCIICICTSTHKCNQWHNSFFGSQW